MLSHIVHQFLIVPVEILTTIDIHHNEILLKKRIPMLIKLGVHFFISSPTVELSLELLPKMPRMWLKVSIEVVNVL